MKGVFKALFIAFGQSTISVNGFTTSFHKRSAYNAYNACFRFGGTRGSVALLSTRSPRRSGNGGNGGGTQKRRSRNGNGKPNGSGQGQGPGQRRRGSSTQTRSGPSPRNQRSPGSGSGSRQSKLLQPSIVFTNNHLLLVNKPPGYHSQPNESPSAGNNKKCMLSKLKGMELGGGKANDFLLPMHRLDQPCTGILLLAKNSKAGTRTGNAFRKHLVDKDYFCVVSGNIKSMKQNSERLKNATYKVSGIMSTKKNKNRHQSSRGSKGGGNSVLFSPIKNQNAESGDGRVCHIEWQHLITVPKLNDVHLIRVKTGTGAKHQVRAMLAQLVKSPVCGDLRYGAREPLPDQSVALHARSLCLPSVKLGDMDMKNTKFVAPIPQAWSQYFSLTEEMIQKKVKKS